MRPLRLLPDVHTSGRNLGAGEPLRAGARPTPNLPAPNPHAATQEAQTAVPDTTNLHVLLIGIDAYPNLPPERQLQGCVNDIDAIEALVLDAPGIGMPADRVHVTRLASPHDGRPKRSRFTDTSRLPTRANILAAMRALAESATQPDDRVLIYYSGHGAQAQWTNQSWHEALVAIDADPFNKALVHDVEINAWINAIAARPTDLTVILDCCHSSGATREINRQSDAQQTAVRALNLTGTPVAPPDEASLPATAGTIGREAGGRLLQAVDPKYVVTAACLSDETAGEKVIDGRRHGLLTHSLLTTFKPRSAEERARLRWADVWPGLVDTIFRQSSEPPRLPPQHPLLIGRSERRIFGGPWERQDAGFAVTSRGGGYEVRAGAAMGITEGAVLAVYGPKPALFPILGTPEDTAARLGRVRVTSATRAGCVAEVDGDAFALPEGARARLVQPGAAEKLPIDFPLIDPETHRILDASGLLEVVNDSTGEVTVIVTRDGGWKIGNDLDNDIARVPPGRRDALRAGLESYARYNAALRLKRTCCDPQLQGKLTVRLLEVKDPDRFRNATGVALEDAIDRLPEAPRNTGGDYALPKGFEFCISVRNDHPDTLHVALLNCTAGGKVEYAGDAVVRGGSRETLWLSDEIGETFPASPSMGRLKATDRLIAVATTREGVSFKGLAVDDNVQEVIDAMLAREVPRGGTKDITKGKPTAPPAELWTASETPIVIYAAGENPD